MATNRILIISLLALAPLIFPAQARPSADVHLNIEQVRKLDVKTAASDAKAALARGDKRLLAVYGFTLSVPGGPQQGDAHIWRDTTGLRILDGTSDAIHGEAGRRFNDNARAYAEKYNKVMLSEH